MGCSRSAETEPSNDNDCCREHFLFMAHFPVVAHVPGFDTVVVVEAVWSLIESADCDEFCSRGLRVADLVRASGLQAGFATIPSPRERESCYRFN